MSTLARLYDFTPNTAILSGEVDGEFNQIVNLLNSTSTNVNAIIRFSDAAVAPLKLDQLSTGPIQQWAAAGVVKATVTTAGSFSTGAQFISTLATGTKPIDVSSITLCTNLNADLLDGREATAFLLASDSNSTTPTFAANPAFIVSSTTKIDNLNADLLDGLSSGVFVRNDTASQQVTTDFKITGTAPLLTFEDTTAAAADWEWILDASQFVGRFAGGADILNINNSSGLIINTFNLELKNTAPTLQFTDTTASAEDHKLVLDANTMTYSIVSGSDLWRIRESSGAHYFDFLSGLGKVTFDTATITPGIPRVLSVNTSSVGNVGAGEDDLMSYTIPANTLITDGDFIRFEAHGSIANNGATKTIKVYVNSSALLTATQAGSFALSWMITGYIVRLSNTTVRTYTKWARTHTSFFTDEEEIDVERNTTLSVNSLTGSTNTLKLTGTATNNNDIVNEVLIVERVNL